MNNVFVTLRANATISSGWRIRFFSLGGGGGHNSLQWARASSVTRFLHYTQRCTTVGRTPLDEWLTRRRGLYLTTHNTPNRRIHAPCGIRTHHLSNSYALGYGYIGARNNMPQQSVHTPDKEVEIKNITVCVSGYIETDPTEILSPPTVCRKQSEFVSSRQSGQIPAAVRIAFECHVSFKFHSEN
jgi:hypothetical protein